MKREGTGHQSPSSPKIARLSSSQEDGDEGSGPSSSTSEVSSSWLSTLGESSQGPELGHSSSCEAVPLSGNSLDSSQTLEDPNTESSCSGERSVEGSVLSGAARTTAITDLPVIISSKFISLVDRNSLSSARRDQNGDAQVRHFSGPTTFHVPSIMGSKELLRHSPTFENFTMRRSPISENLTMRRSPTSDNLSQIMRRSPTSENLMRRSPTSENLMRRSPASENFNLTLHDSPALISGREDSERPASSSPSNHHLRLQTLQRARESSASHRESPPSFSNLRHQVMSETARDKPGISQINTIISFGQGQNSLGKHVNASGLLNSGASEHHQSASSSQASVALPSNSMASFSGSQAINSIPRLGGDTRGGGPPPHHSVYETSCGSLFRSTTSRLQSLSTSLSPSSLRMPGSRPDGVSLMPRRKSHSESTVTRYIGIEGSSARSRGLATFSDLRSGYQPGNNQSPPSLLPSPASTPVDVGTPSADPERVTISGASRRIDMAPPNTAATSDTSTLRQQQRLHLNEGMMSRMRNMYQSWSAAVVAAGEESGLSSTSLNPLVHTSTEGLSLASERALLPRGLVNDTRLPFWWQNNLENLGQVDASPDTPKSFAAPGDETSYETGGATSSTKKNYAALIKKTGPYILGPRIGSSPVHSIVQCLARRERTNKFYIIKILTLADPAKETTDDRQGKMLMLTEFSLLSQLKDMKGVVHCRDFFKDKAWDAKQKCDVNRLCLVVDCLMPHDYDPESHYLVNLQHHVIHEKKLSEKEALIIFWDIARIVEQLHKRDIVHRDLKLGNMIVDRRSWRVTITNFCLGKHLSSERDKLRDQRGSPAYISPDVLSGKPYFGKPSDMWALGVVLFTMLYGQFPFYDCMPQELFRKIKTAEFTIPNDGRVTEDTKHLIHQLLTLDPQTRMTAGQVVDTLESIIGKWKGMMACETDQVVPDIPTSTDSDFKQEENEKFTQTDQQNGPAETSAVIEGSGSSNRQLMIKFASDARPISQAEIRAIRHLFTSRC